MGALMGLAAGFGGAGQALQQNGAQIRGILEQRREGLAQLLSQTAQSEADPQTRSEMLQHSADLLSGKPMGAVATGLFKTVQNRVKDEQQLQQVQKAIGAGTGAPPPPPPAGPVPGGQSPGTGGNAAQPSPAAQPGSNPISGPSTIQGLPGASALDQPIQPISQAQTAPAPPTPSSPFDVRARREQIIQDFNSRIQGATPAMRPFLQNELQQELANLAPFEQLEVKQSGLKGLQGTPGYQSLPEWYKTSLAAEAYGLTPPPMGGLMMPRMMSTGTYGKQAPPGTVEYGTNKPVDPNTKYRVNVIPGTGETIWTPEAAPLGVSESSSGERSVVEKTPGASLGTASGIVSAQQRPRQMGVDAQGHPVFESVAGAQAGAAPVVGTGVSPAFIPTTHESMRSITTTDANGNPVTQLVPVTSTSKKGLGGAGASVQGGPSAGTSFPKAFTPEQQLKNVQSEGQYKLAIDRAEFVQKNLPLLNSLIDAKKLSLQIDPHSGLLMAAVNRAVPLTAKEAEFLGAFQNLREDINLLRGPLGATGFRGPEAFAALQAQAGGLLARPEVTKEVLNGTIKALKIQQGALKNANSGKGVNQPGTPSTVPPAGSAEDDFVIRHGGR